MSNQDIQKNNYRILSRVIIEATTPLAVGNGEQSVLSDSVVATDVNGLPYILGTSIAGVVRSMFPAETDKLFGARDATTGKSQGSKIIFSEARMLGENKEVLDGLQSLPATDYYSRFKKLPIRQHVRINSKGCAEDGGKFDNQVVFKGTRFCFEIEIVSNDNNVENLNKVIGALNMSSFRLGGGTRSGYGEVKVISVQTRVLDLSTDYEIYANKSSNLADSEFWGNEKTEGKFQEDNKWIRYHLEISPENLFLFGSGFNDNDANIAQLKEDCIVEKDDQLVFKECNVIMPGSSIKGAFRHRTIFHLNRLYGNFADTENQEAATKVKEAEIALFGNEGTAEDMKQKRSNIIISDIIESRKVEDKILNHIKIDRFTGGGLDGQLYSEKVTYAKDNKVFCLNILVNKGLTEEHIYESIKCTLDDLQSGLLHLGGGVNRGHGGFKGVSYIEY